MVASVRRFLAGATPLTWLMLINIGVYVASVLTAVGFYAVGRLHVFERFYYSLLLPAEIHTFFRQPWSLFSHMFAHDWRGFLHILVNMLWLYWMGRLFMTTQASVRLYWVYFLGGIAGAVGYLTYAWLHGPYNGYAMGASAAVNGVFFATVMLMPHFRVYLLFIGPIALRWLALIWIFLDLVLTLNGGEAAAIAHLCGAGAGVGIGYLLRNGWKPENLSQWMPFSLHRQDITPEEVDRILDKINQKGLKSLTRKERDILKRAAEKL
ncbi:MAG: rhomboid family intramembrane serine protease [Bacteroidia bacterium]|nr:rhomboid family intramembrane serine protease [Bacteroidia bacterium]